ncbi:MAG: hypothetical protein ACPH44_07825 [Parvibaculales bacterium]
MRKPLLALTIALLAMPLATPLIVSEANALPKCRNVAGYEPKPTCEARNQRAQWQAEQTARMTAQLVADALAQQAAAEKADAADGGGFMATVNGIIGTIVETVSGLF